MKKKIIESNQQDKPKHILHHDDLLDILNELNSYDGGDYHNKFIERFCTEILSADTIYQITSDLEHYVDYVLELSYKEDWEEEYLDEDGNILPEYEDDKYVKHIVETEGEGDWIYEITGVEPEDGF